MPFARAHELRGECGRASASSLEAARADPPGSGPRTGELLLEESVGEYAESRIDAAAATPTKEAARARRR